jgi:hypothetical protein
MAMRGLVVLVALAQAFGAPPGGDDETLKRDCGVNSLFILLRLEGHSVGLSRLLSALPPRNPDGYSMIELSEAARAVGVALEGVRFSKGDKALARPAIAFLKQEGGGHFAVLRPVGTTGKMVQVIDPPSPPWVADYDRAFATKPWTGRVLMPRTTRSVQNTVALPMAVAGIAIMAVALRRHMTPPRQSEVRESVRGKAEQ